MVVNGPQGFAVIRYTGGVFRVLYRREGPRIYGAIPVADIDGDSRPEAVVLSEKGGSQSTTCSRGGRSGVQRNPGTPCGGLVWAT